MLSDVPTGVPLSSTSANVSRPSKTRNARALPQGPAPRSGDDTPTALADPLDRRLVRAPERIFQFPCRHQVRLRSPAPGPAATLAPLRRQPGGIPMRHPAVHVPRSSSKLLTRARFAPVEGRYSTDPTPTPAQNFGISRVPTGSGAEPDSVPAAVLRNSRRGRPAQVVGRGGPEVPARQGVAPKLPESGVRRDRRPKGGEVA